MKLPPVFAYRMCELMDPSSGWWGFAYTEQAIKTAIYILMDVYFNLRLFSMSTHLAGALGELNLDAELGCAENVADFRRLLGVIESTDYSSKPSSWTFHGDVNARVGAKQSRRGWVLQGPSAEFIYYDPWLLVALLETQAKQILRGERRRIPDGLLLIRWQKYPARAGLLTCWRRLLRPSQVVVSARKGRHMIRRLQ